MGYRIAADLLVVLHLAFIAFVVLGGLLAWWRRQIAWLHLPAVLWGVLLEFNGWLCPLTPWEQRLRMLAGDAGYRDGFIAHYLLPVIYPAGLERDMQTLLAGIVIGVNVLIYGALLVCKRRAA
jgi:hypothetical protein